MPGVSGMPGRCGTLSHPEVLVAVKDLGVMVAFQDVVQKPANMPECQSNPKVINLMN